MRRWAKLRPFVGRWLYQGLVRSSFCFWRVENKLIWQKFCQHYIVKGGRVVCHRCAYQFIRWMLTLERPGWHLVASLHPPHWLMDEPLVYTSKWPSLKNLCLEKAKWAISLEISLCTKGRSQLSVYIRWRLDELTKGPWGSLSYFSQSLT